MARAAKKKLSQDERICLKNNLSSFNIIREYDSKALEIRHHRSGFLGEAQQKNLKIKKKSPKLWYFRTRLGGILAMSWMSRRSTTRTILSRILSRHMATRKPSLQHICVPSASDMEELGSKISITARPGDTICLHGLRLANFVFLSHKFCFQYYSENVKLFDDCIHPRLSRI